MIKTSLTFLGICLVSVMLTEIVLKFSISLGFQYLASALFLILLCSPVLVGVLMYKKYRGKIPDIINQVFFMSLIINYLYIANIFNSIFESILERMNFLG